MAKTDPYALDMSAGKQITSRVKGAGNMGIPCPLKNYGKPCGVCERAKRLFSTGDPRDEEKARKIYHKKQIFVNVEFIKQPGTTYLMMMPVKCAEMLLDNMYGSKAWGNVIHPVKGLPLILKKYKGGDGNTNYSISPKVAAEESEKRVSSKKVLTNAYPFNTVIADIQEGKIENMFIPRADMSIGQSVLFKLLPNVEDPSQPPLFIGYYHYNVTEAEIKNVSNNTADEFDNAELVDPMGTPIDNNTQSSPPKSKPKEEDSEDDLDLSLDDEDDSELDLDADDNDNDDGDEDDLPF